MLKVIDRWTTQHGSWDVNPANPYGIDQAHRDKYLAGRDIPGAGGDHHIFVKVPPYHKDTKSHVLFVADDISDNKWLFVEQGEWCNFPIYGGPWSVWVDNVKVADAITLPGNEHVSTFLVVEDVAEAPAPTPGPKRVRVIVETDGVADVVFDSWDM